MAIGGAVIADMYPPGERMRPMACYSAGTMLGPTLGPVLGGITTGSLDWRWVFWIASILVRPAQSRSDMWKLTACVRRAIAALAILRPF